MQIDKIVSYIKTIIIVVLGIAIVPHYPWLVSVCMTITLGIFVIELFEPIRK